MASVIKCNTSYKVGDKIVKGDSTFELIDKIGKKWILTCSNCSGDTELFPIGSMSISNSNLRKGQHPSCLCSTNPQLSREQNLVLIKRECISRDYEFIDFVDKYTTKNETKILLKDKLTGDIGVVRSIYAFLAGGDITSRVVGPSGKMSMSKTRDNQFYTDMFMKTGVFPEGTIFTKTDTLGIQGRFNVWKITCPVCSTDMFSKVGLGDGNFTSVYESLRAGSIPCRCSPLHALTPEQNEYNVQDSLQKRNLKYKYIGFHGNWSGTRTKIRLLCPDHGEFSPSLNDFINNGIGCPPCSKNGYNRSKEGYLYVLKVESLTNSFTGYGISNTINRRLATHRRVFKGLGYSIVESKVFKGRGEYMQKLEKIIQKEFEVVSQDIPGFVTEATKVQNYDGVVALLAQDGVTEFQLDTPEEKYDEEL